MSVSLLHLPKQTWEEGERRLVASREEVRILNQSLDQGVRPSGS